VGAEVGETFFMSMVTTPTANPEALLRTVENSPLVTELSNFVIRACGASPDDMSAR
jgi:hypothetical protein